MIRALFLCYTFIHYYRKLIFDTFVLGFLPGLLIHTYLTDLIIEPLFTIIKTIITKNKIVKNQCQKNCHIVPNI